MGTNQTNKIFDDQKSLTKVKKAKALLAHYKISKQYNGDLATFLKVVFGKGGVVRLLADSKKTKEHSYFAVLANNVHAAYIKCKYENIQQEGTKVGEELKEELDRLKEFCDNDGYADAESLREAKKELIKFKARDWAFWKLLRTIGYVSILFTKMSIGFKAISVMGRESLEDKVNKSAAKVKEGNDDLKSIIDSIKEKTKAADVIWGTASGSMSTFLNVCASEGKKYCSQKKITRFSREIDKAKFEIADILQNIKTIPTFKNFV